MTLLGKLGSSMGARIAMAVLNYGLFWDLSHRLPAEALGGFSLLMNIFFLVQALPLLGLSSVVMRRVATVVGADEGALRRELSTALVFALPVGGLIAAAVVLDGRWAYPAALHGAFDMLALSLLPSAAILVIECVLLGREQMTVVARVQCLEAFGRTLLGVLAVHQGWGLTGVFAAVAALRFGGLVLYLGRGGLPLPRLAAVDGALWRAYWRDVPVFLAIVALAAIAARVDVIVLSKLRPLAEVGLYAAAARLYDAALMLPTVAAMVVMPVLARSFQADPARFHTHLAGAVRTGLVVGLLPALLVAALAEPIIAALYTPSLAAAAPVLRWLILGAVLMTVDQMLSSTMLAAGAQDQDLRTMLIAVASLLLGLMLLVPLHGPLGAAWAVLLALVARVGWRLRWVLRTGRVQGFGADLLRWALAALLAVAALWGGLRWHPAAAAAAGLSAYGLALWMAGLVGPDSPAHCLRAWHSLRGRASPAA